MSVMQQMQAKSLNTRTALISIVLFVLATAGVMTMVIKNINGSSAADTPRTPHTPQAPAAMTVKTALLAKAAGKKVVSAPTGKDYTVIVSRNLFKPRIAVTADTPPAAPVDKNPFGGFKPVNVNAVAPFQPKSVALHPQMAFTGRVEIAGETYALLENVDEHLSQYTHIGSTAYGCKLTAIAESSVTLEAGGAPFTLNIGDNKVEEAFTPPPAAPAPAPAPNAQNAAPGAAPGNGPGMRGQFGNRQFGNPNGGSSNRPGRSRGQGPGGG